MATNAGNMAHCATRPTACGLPPFAVLGQVQTLIRSSPRHSSGSEGGIALGEGNTLLVSLSTAKLVNGGILALRATFRLDSLVKNPHTDPFRAPSN